MKKGFDFELHRTRAWQAYGTVRDRYERFATAVEAILRMALKDLPIHHISARAKDLDRFADKAAKPDPSDPVRPKYDDPLSQIEDLAGARIITYVLRTLPAVEAVIAKEFDISERSDKADQLLEKALVGYRSVHLIVQLKRDRTRLLEYQEFDGLKIEIQIRTILQHAWAEIEHDMRYKPNSEPNKELSQRFTALAGLIEVGDREFDQIYEIDDRRRKRLLDLAQMNDAVPEPIDNNKPKKKEQGNGRIEQASTEEQLVELAATTELQPRDLMALGRYSEAIVKYSEHISYQPKQFAHYLGRSKARFLSGDVDGALSDLSRAEELSPKNPIVSKVRDLIEGRDTDARPGGEQSLAVRQGHTALRDGNSSEALLRYEEAEQLGFNPVFSVFNRSMARFLERKYDLTRHTLDRIDPYPGSVLEFNVIVLRTLCYLMSGGEKVDEAVKMVQSKLMQMIESVNYQYNARSPLVDLEAGVRKSFGADELQRIEPVFALLNHARPPAPGGA